MSERQINNPIDFPSLGPSMWMEQTSRKLQWIELPKPLYSYDRQLFREYFAVIITKFPESAVAYTSQNRLSFQSHKLCLEGRSWSCLILFLIKAKGTKHQQVKGTLAGSSHLTPPPHSSGQEGTTKDFNAFVVVVCFYWLANDLCSIRWAQCCCG